MAENNTQSRKWLLTINNPSEHGLNHAAICEILEKFKKLDYWCTQVNVFAIQTDDETGGAWIQGGSGKSLTEKLFGEYTPYNASGIASVDWAWIADVVLFAILVLCFFKIVAGVMKRV